MTLEDIVKKNETGKKRGGKLKTALTYTWELGKACLATKAGLAIAGIDAVLSGGAFTLGAAVLKKAGKKPLKTIELAREYTKGAIMGVVGSEIYDIIGKGIPGRDAASMIKRAIAAIVPGNMTFNAAYIPVNRIVENDYSIKNIKKDYEGKYSKLNKRTWKYLSIPLGLTVNGYLGGYPGMIAMDAGFNIIANLKRNAELPVIKKYL